MFAQLQTTPSTNDARRSFINAGHVSQTDQKRIVTRIAKDHNFSEEHAERVFNGTIAYLKLCARFPERRLSPSKDVDKGWHTFLLYTRAYRMFCRSLGRDFIDHEPNDGAVVKLGGYMSTFTFMEEFGEPFDKKLWPEPTVPPFKLAAFCSSNDCSATDCRNGDDD